MLGCWFHIVVLPPKTITILLGSKQMYIVWQHCITCAEGGSLVPVATLSGNGIDHS